MAEIINALPQGTVLKGPKNRYQIQRILGQGTFGITYLATTEMEVSGQMGSFTATIQVTVKEFFMKDFNGREGSEVTSNSQGSYFTDYKRKFLREAENLSKLKHPHIVKVLESFETNGTAYFAMEYLEAGSLDLYIQKKGALTEAEALPLIRQIGSALEEMHAHQMLHLDLKPSNVMLRKTGEVVLIDFGLSKQFDEKGEPESSTKLGGGTLGYAPLEQAHYQRGDGLPVTMDVYALGATLYKMLTGERPPEASEVLNDGLPTDLLVQKGVSSSTIAAVEKAMAPLRKKRYQSVREMLEALGNSIADDGNTMAEATVIEATQPRVPKASSFVKPSSTPSPKTPKVKKLPREVWIICIVIGIVIAAWRLWPDHEEKQPQPSVQENPNSVVAVNQETKIEEVEEIPANNNETPPQLKPEEAVQAVQPPKNQTEPQGLYTPSEPTPINVRSRTIRDLLFFPYGCLPKEIGSKVEAQNALTANFGTYETINAFYYGLHQSDAYDYTYHGTPIGVCYICWSDDVEELYQFYLDTKGEAESFYSTMVDEIIKAGIPLKKDKVYGGMSNRNHPVSIFKWVYVDPPQLITKDDLCCNINWAKDVGKYMVKLGVYKRKAK